MELMSSMRARAHARVNRIFFQDRCQRNPKVSTRNMYIYLNHTEKHFKIHYRAPPPLLFDLLGHLRSHLCFTSQSQHLKIWCVNLNNFSTQGPIPINLVSKCRSNVSLSHKTYLKWFYWKLWLCYCTKLWKMLILRGEPYCCYCC